MKLYTMPDTCALAAHIVIKWADLDIDVEVMAPHENRQPSYLALNPHGKVPALMLDDGSILTEAAAILPLLAELAPAVRLGGRDPRQRARIAEALGFMIGEVHSDWTPHFAPQRYLAEGGDFIELERSTFERLGTQYAFLEERMGQNKWYLSGRCTVADAYLYMLARTADLMPDALRPYPKLAAFRARLDVEASVVAALAEQSAPGIYSQKS